MREGGRKKIKKFFNEQRNQIFFIKKKINFHVSRILIVMIDDSKDSYYYDTGVSFG